MISIDRKKALSRVLSDITGLIHIFDYQNTKTPENTHFSSRIQDSVGTGRGEKILTRNLAGQPVENQRFSEELVWYIQGTGEGCIEAMKNFCRSVRLTKNIDRLREDVNVSIRQISPVLDITEQRGSEYIERVSCDFRVQTFGSAEAVTYEIEKVIL